MIIERPGWLGVAPCRPKMAPQWLPNSSLAALMFGWPHTVPRPRVLSRRVWTSGRATPARSTTPSNVTKRDGQLGAVSLSGQVTVTFTVRSVATTDLTVKAFMEQKGTGSRWNMVGSAHQLSVPSQLLGFAHPAHPASRVGSVISNKAAPSGAAGRRQRRALLWSDSPAARRAAAARPARSARLIGHADRNCSAAVCLAAVAACWPGRRNPRVLRRSRVGPFPCLS